MSTLRDIVDKTPYIIQIQAAKSPRTYKNELHAGCSCGCNKCEEVKAGGPGSGCQGENCGRPFTRVAKSVSVGQKSEEESNRARKSMGLPPRSIAKEIDDTRSKLGLGKTIGEKTGTGYDTHKAAKDAGFSETSKGYYHKGSSLASKFRDDHHLKITNKGSWTHTLFKEGGNELKPGITKGRGGNSLKEHLAKVIRN